MSDFPQRLGEIRTRAALAKSFAITFLSDDVTYLLGELRKRDEALARVEALADQAEDDRRVRQDDNPTAMIAYAVVDVDDLRAAVTGDGA